MDYFYSNLTDDRTRINNIDKLGKTLYFLQELYGADMIAKVFASITSYREGNVQKHHIQHLPHEYIMYLDYVKLMSFWDVVPIEIKNNKNFVDSLPCYKHYNITSYNGKEIREQIDGPPTSRSRCYYCRSEFEINPSIEFEPYIPDYMVAGMTPADILNCYDIIQPTVNK